jgi:cytochrome c oxidase cbb3-type subunit 2
MFDFHKDHQRLVNTGLTVFVLLSIVIAVAPAYKMQNVEALPQHSDLTVQQRKGLAIYISEGCVACHTQQVRNIEMDEVWGERPSMPSDYFYSKQRMDIWRQSPSLLGSERTGPDLTNVGNRQPGAEWHLMHLYNPRSVVPQSIMPSYSWLFIEKDTATVDEADVIVPISPPFGQDQNKRIIATEEVLQLVAYLQSLKQLRVGEDAGSKFIPSSREKEQNTTTELDGEQLFLSTCSACHQSNGKGVVGAFPSLAGSAVVNAHDPSLLLQIMLQGYDARKEYGQMPGFAAQLSDEEIAAIANHERSSWGNEAPSVLEEDVKAIRAKIKEELNQ